MASNMMVPTDSRLRENLQERALAFLKGKSADHKGRTVEYYINEMTEDEMEKSHDWVQWAFPIDSYSPHNSHAGNLFMSCQPHFKTTGIATKNSIRLLDKYLRSIGIDINHKIDGRAGTVTAIDANKFFSVVDSPFNHHTKRISRLLRHLVLTGFTYRASCLVADMTDELILPSPSNFSAATVAYWNKIAYHSHYRYDYYS